MRSRSPNAFAARAGLGWIGKHTNLIAPHLGSYVFLAEVLTTLALEADPPLRTSCGSCTRCIVACPTGALRGDGSIDAGRCISDLTQRRDAIPLPLRPLMGDWVWGCDLCQEACPSTQRAGRHGQTRFAPAGRERAYPDLLRLLALPSSEFKRRFRRTAMGWRGPVVLRRNAAVALGTGLDRAAVPALRGRCVTIAAALVRGHAAWALGRIGSPAAHQALREAAHTESDVGVRLEIDGALKLFGTSNSLVCAEGTSGMLKRFLILAAVALGAFVGAGPLRAESPVDSSPIFHRMTALNAHLKSYQADVHVDAAMKSFPPISPSFDGTLYFKQPDKQAVVFQTVPVLAGQLKKVYPHVEPPALWPQIYTMSLIGDDSGVTTIRLVPKKHGRVAHLDIKADDANATIKNMTWTYEDGGSITFDQTFTTISGNYLVKSQTGHVDLPSYKADVKSAFTNYKLNVPVSDDVFKEQQ